MAWVRPIFIRESHRIGAVILLDALFRSKLCPRNPIYAPSITLDKDNFGNLHDMRHTRKGYANICRLYNMIYLNFRSHNTYYNPTTAECFYNTQVAMYKLRMQRESKEWRHVIRTCGSGAL